jgi:hypothetical protein
VTTPSAAVPGPNGASTQPIAGVPARRSRGGAGFAAHQRREPQRPQSFASRRRGK